VLVKVGMRVGLKAKMKAGISSSSSRRKCAGVTKITNIVLLP
jgi:hypothetical protein